jgi:NAD-dependent dihydropyrimidine dehydrogenase PreA subunit
MAKDLSTTQWHGVPRKEIPWFPTIDPRQCIGCELCYVTCGRHVFEIAADKYHKASVSRPYNCMVGCSTCAMVCPTEAIDFPDRDVIWKVEREHKIFRQVHVEARERKEKAAILKEREKAEAALASILTRSKIEIAGEFGDKRFLVKLAELIHERPFDIVNLRLEVPTVKGLLEHTPAYMSFELTSTAQKDIGAFLDEVKNLVKSNGLVLVSATP